jgi:hypothetical protein
MRIDELLLTEFDEEMKKTRTMLERLPAAKGDFTPHPRSTPLGRLAPHVAQLGVYLRLNDEPVPATYGPSADEKLGF